MSLYEDFAYMYAAFHLRPEIILGTACGEGTCPDSMAVWGYQVSGADQSRAVLAIGSERAGRKHIPLSSPHAGMARAWIVSWKEEMG